MASAGDGIVTYRGAIYATHCDHMGHMNVAAYGAKFDEATWVFFCEVGLKPTYLRSSPYGMAAVQQNITYKRELFAGDVIEIRTIVVEVAEKRLRFRHVMRSLEGDYAAAECEINGVHLDKKAHKGCPLPDEVRARAQALMGSGS